MRKMAAYAERLLLLTRREGNELGLVVQELFSQPGPSGTSLDGVTPREPNSFEGVSPIYEGMRLRRLT